MQSTLSQNEVTTNSYVYFAGIHVSSPLGSIDYLNDCKSILTSTCSVEKISDFSQDGKFIGF